MYIGRLQLKGFKSFGGNHELILSSGFTAIVGPNGSGKSNLLDALRWSLGDSNAARLRISRQSDLVFQGSASREKAAEAEVLLQLHDNERFCTIKRRVSAPDGTTSLFVDNSRKTLIELDSVKRDWKLAGTRFAFIGQGEVQEMLKQTPSDRRMYLEVLFGIDIYRKKRMEAQDRLVSVMEEHDRLRHLMGELFQRREEIAPEVERALQKKEIIDRAESDRKMLYWQRRAECEHIISVITAELSAASSVMKGVILWSRLWKSACEKITVKIDQATRDQSKQTWELEQCRRRFDDLTKSGYASAANLRNARARIADCRIEEDEARKQYKTLLSEQSKYVDENKKSREEVEKAERALKAIEKKWAEYNERLERTKKEREKWNSEKGRLDGELQKCRAKLSYLGKEILDMRGKKETMPESDKELDLQIKIVSDERERLTNEQAVLLKKHSEIYALCQTLAAEAQKSKREAASLRSKLNDAADALQAGVYPSPVRFLLSSAKLKRLNANPRAVIDVFTAPSELAPALEAYLGGRQFQLLVEDMEEAGRCIDRLKQNAAGTATFLPLERARPRFPNASMRLPNRGIIGWATELMKIEEHWTAAIQHIMGDLLIVDRYETGKELVRSGCRNPIVTMEGDVFQPGGTVSGGKSQKSGRALEMKAQVAKLEKEAEKAQREADTLSKKYKAAEADEIAAADEKEEYTKKIRELNGKIAVMQDKKDALARERKRAAGERLRILNSIKSEGQNWMALLNSIRELEEKRDSESDVEDDRQLIEEREKCRSRAAVAAKDLSSGFAMMERIRNDVRSREEKLKKVAEEMSELDQICVRERSNLARVGGSCLEIFNRKNEILAEMEEYGSAYSKLTKIKEYITGRSEKAQERMKGEDEKYSAAEAKKNSCEHDIEELKSNWEEQFPYPGAENVPKDVDVDELRRRIRDGDRKIKSFGDVNMGVLSEDESLADRLQFLGTQLDDVKKSSEEIQSLITDADMMAHKQFSDALVKVDERFCQLFKVLFGGGEAHLIMTEGETIWKSGVEIDARLPGKHTQVLNQYSGGERSLISISLLFATMEVADSPIAVLDEVDAALDEANLRRFSDLTKEYAKSRQILAMTHRRATMERADVLYGVTLQEQGLSQIVGVRMEDWK
ncbi:MAG: chromosome segregation protein SMC [Synergistes sp.]|nr:chromosome segregation protein SMC [Synergistes sp.]